MSQVLSLEDIVGTLPKGMYSAQGLRHFNYSTCYEKIVSSWNVFHNVSLNLFVLQDGVHIVNQDGRLSSLKIRPKMQKHEDLINIHQAEAVSVVVY